MSQIIQHPKFEEARINMMIDFMTSRGPVDLPPVNAMEMWCMLSAIQLACKHPSFQGDAREHTERLANELAKAVYGKHEGHAPALGTRLGRALRLLKGLKGKEPMEILPTGRCFDEACEIIIEMVKDTPSVINSDRVFITHALCVSEEGVRWSHAWVEDRVDDVDCCLWMAIHRGEKVCFCTDRESYYAEFRPEKIFRYTIRQFVGMEISRKHGGPWEQIIIDHCAKEGEPLRRIGSFGITEPVETEWKP